MLTGLANLGPPLRGQPDKMTPKSSKSAEGAGSFDQVLKTKSNDAPRMAGIKNKDVVPNISKKIETQKTKEEQPDGEIREKITAEDEVEEIGLKKPAVRTKNKEDVMLDFMDSMESEFGIAPEEIVGALASVSEQSLSKSPEATASEVIQKLDLPTEDRERAEEAYLSFLAEMSKFPTPEVSAMTSQAMQASIQTPMLVPNSLPKATPVEPPKVLPARFQEMERRNQLNASLDRMNESFFLKNQPAQQNVRMQAYQDQIMASANPLAAPIEMPMQDSVDMSASVLATSSKLQGVEVPEDMQPVDMDLSGYSEDDKAVIKSLAALGAAASALGRSDAEISDASSMKKLDQMNAPFSQGQMMQMSSDQVKPSMGQLGQFSQQEFGKDAGSSEGSDSDLQSLGDSENSSDFSMPSFNPEQVKGDIRSSQSNQGIGAGAMTAGFGAMGAEDKTPASQVIHQAQYLIKKGGGEAKVEMTPEGLGKVHLKVTVNEGKVGIEMATESKEAKKALEGSLSELKHGLSANRLHVDSIKVDMGQLSADSQKNSDSQQNMSKQPDLNQENRDQARQFWQGFRDESFARQQSFYHPKDGSQNSSGRSVEPLTAQGSSESRVNSAKVSRYAAVNKGKGLDLVA